jgi:CheY-like chemotaxis protein
MNSDNIRILLVEDDPADAHYLEELVREDRSASLQFDHVTELPDEGFFESANGYDLILLDLGLGKSHGLETFRKAKTLTRELPIVALTGLDDHQTAIQCVREGAQDYLVKSGLDSSLVTKAVRYALERHRLQRELDSSRRNFENILENSPNGILVLNDSGTLMFANRAAQSIFGKSSDELTGNMFGIVSGGLPLKEVEIVRADGRTVVAQFRSINTHWHGAESELVILNDITALKSAQKQRDELIRELREALAKVKQLSGLIPICSKCHKIRDDQGFWQSLEEYIMENSDALVSHGLCPDCLKGLYPDLDED